jgi:hypothetical protein
LALLFGVVTWKAGASMRAKNIALNKPVTASSFYPLADFAPGGLTDGETAGTYGVHTNREGAPWVQVDLGEVFRIDRIEIYNRNDGWFDDGLPMALLVSENGQEFISVDTRRESFGSSSPWTYLAHERRVRYIRVKGAPGSYVALGEIEAFGKK